MINGPQEEANYMGKQNHQGNYNINSYPSFSQGWMNNNPRWKQKDGPSNKPSYQSLLSTLALTPRQNH